MAIPKYNKTFDEAINGNIDDCVRFMFECQPTNDQKIVLFNRAIELKEYCTAERFILSISITEPNIDQQKLRQIVHDNVLAKGNFNDVIFFTSREYCTQEQKVILSDKIFTECFERMDIDGFILCLEFKNNITDQEKEVMFKEIFETELRLYNSWENENRYIMPIILEGIYKFSNKNREYAEYCHKNQNLGEKYLIERIKKVLEEFSECDLSEKISLVIKNHTNGPASKDCNTKTCHELGFPCGEVCRCMIYNVK